MTGTNPSGLDGAAAARALRRDRMVAASLYSLALALAMGIHGWPQGWVALACGVALLVRAGRVESWSFRST